MAVERWVTLDGTAYVLGTAVDANERRLLVEVDGGRIWVKERDAIRPAVVHTAAKRKAG